jgi:hypothetical protein
VNYLGMAWNKLWQNPVLWLGGLVVAVAVTSVTFGLLLGPLIVGLLRAVDREERVGAQGGIESWFEGFDAFGPALVVGLLSSVLFAALSLCCLFPGLLVAPLQIPALWLVARGEADPVRALTTAWDKVSPRMVELAFMHLLFALAGASGGLVCGVGEFITVPWAFVAAVLVARDIVGPPSASLSWGSPS